LIIKKVLLGCILLAWVIPVQALSIPQPSPYDKRIRTVEYDPRDVVRIDGMVGIATHIHLEEGEKYVDHAFGDAAGWHFAENGNHIFLKPKAEYAHSNLVLITNRRVYYFELRYYDTRRDGNQVFGVSFIYPHTQAELRAAQLEREKVREAFNAPREINANYTMTGHRDLAPINAWDNGQFTFFKFPGVVDIPAIFMVNPDGSESIVNHHIQGQANDIVVMHKVTGQWVLRLGYFVLSVFNESYDAVGESNSSRTASPEVIRHVRGAEP